MMLAEAHASFYSLYIKAQQQLLPEDSNERMSDKELRRIPLRECYLYGSSTANERIEHL
jgi:hypothetical protein